jgi:hypothetical protein
MMIRSKGFSSTFSAIAVTSCAQTKNKPSSLAHSAKREMKGSRSGELTRFIGRNPTAGCAWAG